MYFGVIDDWHDWWRVILLVASLACVITLGFHYVHRGASWSPLRMDYWFATLMWTTASVFMQIEGLWTDSPLRFRLIFVTAAILLTLKILWSKRSMEHHD